VEQQIEQQTKAQEQEEEDGDSDADEKGPRHDMSERVEAKFVFWWLDAEMRMWAQGREGGKGGGVLNN
jgi:hypothetical protein